MTPISRVLLGAGAGAVFADAPAELRAAPVEVAAPAAAITVTFDRRSRLADPTRSPSGFGVPDGTGAGDLQQPGEGKRVVRHLLIFPAAPFTVFDTAAARAEWALETRLARRTSYAISADTALCDVFAQRLTGNPAALFRTSGFQAAINYTYGRAIVERGGLRTLGATHINVDRLDVAIVPVPDSLVPFFMGNEWRWAAALPSLFAVAPVRRVPVRNDRDRARLYGVALPIPDGEQVT